MLLVYSLVFEKIKLEKLLSLSVSEGLHLEELQYIALIESKFCFVFLPQKYFINL